MLKFVDIEAKRPDKREASNRRQDWDEVYTDYVSENAIEQASRCSQCGVPFCQIHCPVQNNIPDWLMLTAAGRLQEAYEVSSATNNFPEICGRICPQDLLCEGNCVIEKGFESVTIGSVERYITDTAFENGWVKPPHPENERPESVGIIGAGPGGLAAAEMLRRLGYQVHVYDRYDRVGGLLIYGIPNFKLEKSIVARRAELLIAAGVEFHLEFEVGRDASLADLRNQHDAVLIATGAYKARDIKVPGVGLNNIFMAMNYLTASNRKGLGDTVSKFDDGTLNAAGKNVVVIGGGDTAMDCVRTAVRQKQNLSPACIAVIGSTCLVRCRKSLMRKKRVLRSPGSPHRRPLSAINQWKVYAWCTSISALPMRLAGKRRSPLPVRATPSRPPLLLRRSALIRRIYR